MTAAEDALLPEYERELALLRRSLSEFAERYPQAAARLAISGEHSEDPHVERLLQSAALLNARVSARIEDDFPELPTALLEVVYPEYLRPCPSCSIAHFEASEAVAKLTKPRVMERGTALKTGVGEYPFRTVYDVVFAPLAIADARYAPTTSAPANVRLYEETSGIVSITFSAVGGNALNGSSMPKRVRLFVDGDPRMTATTIDALLLHTSNAFVEADGGGIWIALDAVPIACAGFDNDDTLIERHGANQSRFRFLFEFFSFPCKFDFVDVDLSMLMRTAGMCTSVTLHLPIKEIHGESPSARCLLGLAASHLKLFCTPVVNLFTATAEPISLKALENGILPVFPIVPATVNLADASVYRVDAVRLTKDTLRGTVVTGVEPYQALSHHTARHDPAAYWHAERGGRFSEILPGHDMLLSFVDASGEITDVAGAQVDLDLTCTNGNLPARLQIANPSGDLLHPSAELTAQISMLRAPTESVARLGKPAQLWDIVAMLSAGALNLCQAGLPAFKRLLAIHAPPRSKSAKGLESAMRHIDSLTHLTREAALEWIQMEPQPMLVRGIRVRLSVDETRLEDCPVSVFARVLESVFVHYAPANSFVQLVLVSARNGADLAIGQPLPGAEVLL